MRRFSPHRIRKLRWVVTPSVAVLPAAVWEAIYRILSRLPGRWKTSILKLKRDTAQQRLSELSYNNTQCRTRNSS
ncbi:hypothetical protein E4T56_gene13096 [Termitomyces sp. T112]|nr:hypothetical protein E4T56_gene13096 [Termitomyces sp. T112]